MFMNNTAAEIARRLATVRAASITTGLMSMLEEATLAFGEQYENVAAPQSLFSRANWAYKNSYNPDVQDYNPLAAEVVAAAAHWLGEELRMLGDIRILRCTAEASWGICNLPLGGPAACDGAHLN